MKIKTYKIFSYCNDFTEEEQDILQKDRSYDCLIRYTAYTKEYLKGIGIEDIIASKLIELGCQHKEEVLIDLDW